MKNQIVLTFDEVKYTILISDNGITNHCGKYAEWLSIDIDYPNNGHRWLYTNIDNKKILWDTESCSLIDQDARNMMIGQ